MDTASPDSDILNEINALFSWNPPFLLPVPDKYPSATSHKPKFYEKHFSDKLVLKKVERLPSLIQDLASNVDKALDAAKSILPPVKNSAFVTAIQRKYQDGERVVRDEEAICNTYHQYTAKYCLPLASTLALHPNAQFSQWLSLLSWTQSVYSSSYAIVDGELRFLTDLGYGEQRRSLYAAIRDTIEDSTRAILDKMKDSRMTLATWEMRSLDAGPSEVMSAVLNLGKFDWTTCTDARWRAHKDYNKKIKVVIRPDAQNPPWSLSSPAEAGPSTLPTSSPSPLEYDPLFSLSPLSSLTPSPPPLTNNDEEFSPTKNKGKQREQDNEFPAQNNSKKRHRDDKEEEEEEDVNMTAQHLVQQAWAQATRVDGTVIVIHSGNHELVCVRHRASQTLYVSDVIEPHRCVEPGYGKLHVGIYIAAIQDAVDRMQQQPPSVSQSSPPSDADTNQDNNRCSESKKKYGRTVKKRRVMQDSSQRKGLQIGYKNSIGNK